MKKLSKLIIATIFSAIFCGTACFASEVTPVSGVLCSTKNAELFIDEGQTVLLYLEEGLPIPVTGVTASGYFQVNIANVTYYMEGTDLVNPAPTTPMEETASTVHPYIQQVVDLVNVERTAYGLGSLTMDSKLNEAAAIRGVEIETLFDHARPNGTSCFTVFQELNIKYGWAGENIAAGQTSPQRVVTAWMNSPGHRANILNSDFHKIGIGYYQADTKYGHYWVQLFTD